MKNIFILNKKEGETPLEALDAFRLKNKRYKNTKMTYAGRLDPMASGLLLILAGDETKNREKYLELSKEYEFQVLFGFSTDTYDILGKIVSKTNSYPHYRKLEEAIKQNMKYFTGKFKQKYPMYSSKTVNGKPLFTYARKGKMVDIPKHEVDVASFKFVGLKKVSADFLLKNIERRIKKINGDFRQEDILYIWRKTLNVKHSVFNIGSFKIKCGSGTYVRSIANDLGNKMIIPALAFSIKRTKIGKWSKIQK